MTSRTIISYLYLALAIAGAVLPTLSNIEFASQYKGFDIGLFIELANSNPAAQSLSRDLAIAAISTTIWIVIESRRLQMRNLWIVLLGSITIAFAFAAPFFLYLRERRLIEIESLESK